MGLNSLYSDGIHLSEGGSKFLVKEILKVLREAEWKPNLYWLSMATEFSGDSPYYTVAPGDKTTVNFSNFMPPWKIEWMEPSEVEAMASKTQVTK